MKIANQHRQGRKRWDAWATEIARTTPRPTEKPTAKGGLQQYGWETGTQELHQFHGTIASQGSQNIQTACCLLFGLIWGANAAFQKVLSDHPTPDFEHNTHVRVILYMHACSVRCFVGVSAG